MSEPIKVGDLVIVVKPGCSNKNLGRVFRVARLSRNKKPCPFCGTHHGFKGQLMACSSNDNHGFSFGRLKKIDPPALDETTDEREELTA